MVLVLHDPVVSAFSFACSLRSTFTVGAAATAQLVQTIRSELFMAGDSLGIATADATQAELVMYKPGSDGSIAVWPTSKYRLFVFFMIEHSRWT